MATISGRVVFDRDRSLSINSGDSGLANVPVVLQNTATNERLVVLTDADGNYSFINVPNGDYRIVEAYGTTGGVPTPGDFNNAVIGPVPTGEDPPISFATNPPAGANALDSVSRNTRLVTISGADLTNQIFYDGPVIYTPIQDILDSCTSVSGINLINAADNGTFGSFPAGTMSNTGAPVEPYPGVTPDFIYVLPNPSTTTPAAGQYTVQNIMNNAFGNTNGTWWRIADHTTGDETGRMMVVNGSTPGAIVFRDTVPVQPNTNYLFSSWILNFRKEAGVANPELGVRILDQSGNPIYSATLGAQLPATTNAPEWKEIGTVINSQNNTSLTVEFVSEGPAVAGNDYAIDDISLREVQVPVFQPFKMVTPSIASVGQVVTYTVTLPNTCTSPLTNVFFQDFVPNGLSFIPGTVRVNGVPNTSANPNIGFNVPDIPGGSAATITFDARIDFTPVPTPVLNTATMNYSYTPVEGGIPNNYTVTSNIAPLDIISSADLSIMKTDNPDPINPGEILFYTIEVFNNGPSQAQNVILSDTVPAELLSPEYSTDGGITWNPWNGNLSMGTLFPGEVRNILIRGFVNPSARAPLVNTANITSTTPDPNPGNNTSTAITEILERQADVSLVKIPIPNPTTPGQILFYRNDIFNNGPEEAQNVVLTDVLPPQLINPEYSLDEGITWNPWPGSIDIGTLPSGAFRTIIIRGTVDPSFTGTIANTTDVTSTTRDPNPNNNTSTAVTEVNPEADISVVKVTDPNPVIPGEMLVYSIDVFNNGPSNAQNVIMTDSISPALSGVEYSTDGGITWNPWTGSLNLGTLSATEVRSILIRGVVNPSTTGTIVNTATVTSNVPDPNPNNNDSTVITDVNPQADLSVMKSAQSPVTPGGVLVYTIETLNNGPSNAQNVVLTDPISSALSDVEYSTDGGITWNPWTGTLNLGTLPAGATGTVLIRGVVDPSASGAIANTANVTSDTPDPIPDNNTFTIVTEVNAEADISVVKISTSNPVVPGQMLVYQVNAFNGGPSDAQNVVLTDAVPPELINPEFSADGGLTWLPWTGSYTIGTLPSGASSNILIRGIVSPSATGAIINTADITSSTPDPNPANNTSTAVTVVNAQADISVVKTASPNPVTPGQELVYTNEVFNAGPSDAQNVVLTDAVPPELINPEYSIDGGITWLPWTGSYMIGLLPNGAVRTILIRGTVSPSATGTITNTADVTSTTPDPNPNNNISTVSTGVAPAESADISVTKSAIPNPVSPGQTVTYTITASNAGPSDAQNVVLTDTVPSEIVNPEYSTDGGLTWNPWTGSYTIGTLPNGASTTILIRGAASPSATGTIENTADITSTTPDPNPCNNTYSVITIVEPVESADVSVTKSASPNPVAPGQTLTYAITASNAGPSDAQNVVITDTIPSGIAGVEFSTDGGITWSPWTGTFNIGTLPSGTSRTILIRGTVSSTAKGTITNTANVTSTTPDPNPNNNTSSVVTKVKQNESADVSIKKTVTPCLAMPGQTIIYTIVVSNAGPANAQNVVLTDAIPSGITNTEYSTDGGATWNPWTGSYNIGTLPSGTSKALLIKGTVSSSVKGTICNTAKITSNTPDPDLCNNTSTADLIICKCKKKWFRCKDKDCKRCKKLSSTYTITKSQPENW